MRIKEHGKNKGHLTTVGYFHTRGETPRHFKFDYSGQYLLVANQDTDNLAVFNFNQSSGEIKFTGNEYRVPSPNFVCCCKLHEDDSLTKISFSSADSAVSEPLSEDGSISTANSKKKLEDDLAKALAEVERIRMNLASLRND
jgi:hypothetical protein